MSPTKYAGVTAAVLAGLLFGAQLIPATAAADPDPPTQPGAVPQRLVLMGSERLEAGAGYQLGPLKIAFDERDPPPLEHLAARIGWARTAGRKVAAHCVTEAELALYLAALDMAGSTQR